MKKPDRFPPNPRKHQPERFSKVKLVKIYMDLKATSKISC